jgi:phosphonate transport system substrate-binding protein
MNDPPAPGHRQHMSGKILIPLLMPLLFCLWGCAQEEPPLKVDLSKRESVRVKTEANVITYAYLPQYSHTVSYQRHHLLVKYLRRETGLNIKQIFPDTFDDHMNSVGRGKIDISFSNPFIYVKIAARYGARAFARIVEIGGGEQFRGQIICRADNPAIKSIEECSGKRWIAVDPASAGGYLYPLGHFIAQGIKPEDFAEIAFAPGPGGKQEKVVLAVHSGKYDVGTIREGTLKVVADKIDVNEIRVIANTRWYPGWVYAARSGLPEEIVSKIKQALLKLDPQDSETRTILDAAHFAKIIDSRDAEFEPVRELSAKIGLRLKM